MKWTNIHDGGSGEWLWVYPDGVVFTFVRIIDLPAWAGHEEGMPLFVAEVRLVDLSVVSAKQIRSALDCVGWEGPGFPDLQSIAEALQAYGTYSPMWGENIGKLTRKDGWWVEPEQDSKEFRSIKRKAFKEAKQIVEDADHRNARLDRVVNRMGQTARQYAEPEGLWNALRAAKDNPDATDEQRLVLKIYQGASQTLGGESIPEDLRADSFPAQRNLAAVADGPPEGEDTK